MDTEKRLKQLESQKAQILDKLDLHTAQKEYHAMQLEGIIEALNKQSENLASGRRTSAGTENL